MYRTVFWTLGEGEDGMIWENGIETCITSHMKRITSPGLMQDTGCLRLVHWDEPWNFFGRNYAKAETPVLWPPHAKS